MQLQKTSPAASASRQTSLGPLSLASLLLTSLFTQSAYAVDVTYDAQLPSCGGFFSDADCWAGGVLPGATDNAFFETSASPPYRVSFDAPTVNTDTFVVNNQLQWDLNGFSYTMNDLQVGGDTGISPFLQITDGLIVSDEAAIGIFNDNTASVLLDGPGTVWNTTTSIVVGRDGTGNLSIQNGATVNNSGFSALGSAATGAANVLVDGPGSSWNTTGEFVVGVFGEARIKVDHGATLNSGAAAVGGLLGDQNTAMVTGAGSTWNTDSLLVGSLGASGKIRARDGGTINVANTLQIGFLSSAGPGTLHLEDGGSVFAGELLNNGLIVSNSGDTAIHGTVINKAFGRIGVSLNSTLTFHDDVEQDGGEIHVSSGSEITYLGVVSGLGDFTGTGTNIFEGGLLPGMSPGALSFEGDVVLGDNNILGIEIGGLLAGTEFDFLDIDGTATLGGILDVDLIDLGGGPFSPSEGDSFDILLAETLDGVFDLLNLANPGAGLEWEIAYLIDEFGSQDVVRLSIISAVPLPGAVWLFGSGLLLLVSRVKRKRV